MVSTVTSADAAPAERTAPGRRVAGSPTGHRRVLPSVAPALVIVAVQQVLFPSTGPRRHYLWGLVLQGLTFGLLIALVALGMALIYRANRILNFAQGDLGLVPVSLAVDLILFSGLNYLLALGLGLAAAVVVGAVVELAIIRRFFRAPRLILTVATIGLAQLLAFASLCLPRIWGEDPLTSAIDVPFDLAPRSRRSSSTPTTSWPGARAAGDGRRRLVPPVHRRRHRRAGRRRARRPGRPARHPGRAAPHLRVGVAAVLSFLALFLRAGVVGLPLGSPVGLTVLLSALAALMLGRLTNLPAIAAAAMALGLLEATSAGTTSSTSARSTSTSAATS